MSDLSRFRLGDRVARAKQSATTGVESGRPGAEAPTPEGRDLPLAPLESGVTAPPERLEAAMQDVRSLALDVRGLAGAMSRLIEEVDRLLAAPQANRGERIDGDLGQILRPELTRSVIQRLDLLIARLPKSLSAQTAGATEELRVFDAAGIEAFAEAIALLARDSTALLDRLSTIRERTLPPDGSEPRVAFEIPGFEGKLLTLPVRLAEGMVGNRLVATPETLLTLLHEDAAASAEIAGSTIRALQILADRIAGPTAESAARTLFPEASIELQATLADRLDAILERTELSLGALMAGAAILWGAKSDALLPSGVPDETLADPARLRAWLASAEDGALLRKYEAGSLETLSEIEALAAEHPKDESFLQALGAKRDRRGIIAASGERLVEDAMWIAPRG
jgi:hypothetical protein